MKSSFKLLRLRCAQKAPLRHRKGGAAFIQVTRQVTGRGVTETTGEKKLLTKKSSACGSGGLLEKKDRAEGGSKNASAVRGLVGESFSHHTMNCTRMSISAREKQGGETVQKESVYSGKNSERKREIFLSQEKRGKPTAFLKCHLQWKGELGRGPLRDVSRWGKHKATLKKGRKEIATEQLKKRRKNNNTLGWRKDLFVS